ncbi:MAG: outer membrane lipoprotein carrier protein LolA [Alphaproteobacteria bacterium]
MNAALSRRALSCCRAPASRRTVLRAGLAMGALTAGLALLPRAALAALSDTDRADLERISRWLNDFETLIARFIQIAPDGAVATGSLWFHRPGRMRIDYDPPVPVIIVSDGGPILYWDAELYQASYLPVAATPARFLLADTISFDGQDVVVETVLRDPGVIRVAVRSARPDEPGQIILNFADRPLQLAGWRLIDAQGQAVDVALTDHSFGVPIPPGQFRFTPPEAPVGRR